MVLPLQLWCLQHTSFSWDAPIPYLQLSLADVSWSWHHQHLGTFNAIQASLSWMYAIVSQDAHAGTSLPHIWPKELSSMVNNGRFRNAFTHASFVTLKPELHEWFRQVWLLTTWDVVRRFNFLLLFRSWKTLSSVHFTSWNTAVWGLSLRVPFPLSHWTSDFLETFHLFLHKLCLQHYFSWCCFAHQTVRFIFLLTHFLFYTRSA